MALTDEQVLGAYVETGSKVKAARKLGVSKQRVSNKLTILHYAGVEFPVLDKRGNKYRYTPERVAELNAYVQRKTQEANTRQG